MLRPKLDRSILRLLLLLTFIAAAGTIGFTLIERDWSILEALYMTVITLTTIGYGEVQELSPQGRVFTILLIISGIGVAATLISRIGQVIVESGLNNASWRNRMLRKISAMQDHYIICGYGKIGSSIALKLFEADIPFVIIESNSELVEIIHQKGFPVVLGDGVSDSTLKAAGIVRARGTILCINDDSTNVNIALAARELNPTQRIIVRGSDPSIEYRLVRAGADTVVYPLRLGGEQIARLLVDDDGRGSGGDIQVYPSLLGYELKLFKNLGDDSTVEALASMNSAVRPVAVRHLDGSMTHNSKPEFPVLAGEDLLLLVNAEDSVEQADAENERVLLEWSDDLSLGVAVIDDEHRTLFEYASEFQKAVLGKQSGEVIDRLFEELIRYTENHFLHEEEIMEEYNYPDIIAHKMLHRQLTAQVMELHKNRTRLFSGNIWQFLQNWLSEHILVTDKAVSDYIKEVQAEQSASL